MKRFLKSHRLVPVCLLMWFPVLVLAQNPQPASSRTTRQPASQVSPVQMQTFVIREGKAYLNGKQLTGSQLPTELDLRGLDVEYMFSVGVAPVIQINNKMFTVEGGSLLAMTRQFKNEAEFGSFLDQQTEQFGQLHSMMTPLESTKQLYFLRNESPDLYQRFQREQWLELQSQRLAVKIRLSAESEQRSQMMNELRKTLGNIFDLRLENQRDEIQQLNNQLILLRSRLRDKEMARERIIQQRLEELLQGQ
ncbi:MAG: hypothetical protein JNN12_16355 [Bacteroidetes Order II. Incertae sedis bacterium]|nr:hypothetical protein [Bacteroidetes Order II. bacterium]